MAHVHGWVCTCMLDMFALKIKLTGSVLYVCIDIARKAHFA